MHFTESINLLGPAAGLLTSVFWTFTSIFFTLASRRIGPTVVNAARIALAILLLAIIHRLFISDSATWIPDANAGQILLLALSGFIGLAIGDQALFSAFVDIGPRLSTLLMTTAPLFATLFAWVFLGERMSLVAWIGMTITISGIAWVILERPRRIGHITSRGRRRGVILALVAAACQACGLMLSKAGIGHGWLEESRHLDPQAATLVRMTFAGVAMVPILLLWRRRMQRLAVAGLRPTRTGSPRSGVAFMVLGTIFGPVLGVWMSLVAADATAVGIAQTLMSLVPIFVLPYAAFIEREHVSWRAALGALVAVAGVALLFREA